ncbi:MAG: hypothetical protein ACLPWS_21380 [Rhodomicrobium sp.]
MAKRTGLVFLVVLTVSANARAGGGLFEDFMGYYAQRTEGVTAGAGDAKELNSAIHTIDPWPPNAANRNIPASGERMSRAIRRYQDVTKLREAAQAPVSEAISPGGAGSNAASSGR